MPLAYPAPDAAIAVATDASDTHIGGVLNQQVRGSWQPLGFFSRKLNVAEIKYSTFDRELLAAAQTIRHFRHMLEGRDFQLHTDHKPLVTAISRISEPWSARQQRHLAAIAEFTSDLRYLPGPQNVVADALSREPGKEETKVRPDCSFAPTQLALCLRFALLKGKSCYELS